MSDFRSSLLLLSDDAFFELIRNYLGPLRTPFNKHDLVDRLEAVLRRPDIQDRILALIDDADAKLLSAIRFLGEPHVEEIINFFASRVSYLELHQLLVNLEDRLLIYRDDGRVRLNPVLEPVLDGVVSAERLFHSHPIAPPASIRPCWITTTLLASFLSLLADGNELTRADGSLRKRTINDLRARIPDLLESARNAAAGDGGGTVVPPVIRFHVLVDALAALGVTHANVERAPVEELAELTAAERVARLAAAFVHAGSGGSESVPAIHRLGAAVAMVHGGLPADRAFSPDSIEQLLTVLLHELTADQARRTREAMILTGLLAEVAMADALAVAPVDDGPTREIQGAPLEHSAPRLVVQPNHEITMPSPVTATDAFWVAELCTLVRHDRYPLFKIDRRRFARTLHAGYAAESVVERLSVMAGGTVPQNVAVTLKSWAHEFESVRLFRGVVLSLEEGRRHIATGPLVASLIRRQLAPGVYLVDEDDVPALQDALSSAGVALVPELPRRSQPRMDGQSIGPTVDDQARVRGLFDAMRTSGPAATPAADAEVDPRAAFLTRLAARNLPADQHQELAARIERKLILREEQLSAAALRTEKTEARGLDYVGKVRIIEHAIRTGAWYLEIIERTEDGSPLRRLIEPTGLEKRGTDLVVVGAELPARSRVEMRVRKLGLVRRLRSGLVRPRPA